MTSIFFLTSIFNNSIHSSIAVFYSDRIHEKWKGRIETWQLRKRQKRRAPKRSNCSSHQNQRGRESVPFGFWGEPRFRFKTPYPKLSSSPQTASAGRLPHRRPG